MYPRYWLLWLVGLVLVGCRTVGRRAGESDASHDLARAVLAIETYGKPFICHKEYSDLLSERYGIQLRTVAGCAVSLRVMAHANAYDKIMNAEIERRFGTTSLRKTLADAARLYADTYARDHPPE